MRTVQLGELAKLIRGITFKPDEKCDPGDNGAVVCMRTKNVQSSLDVSDLIAVPSSLVKNQEKMINVGDILVSSANSWNLVGKCCQIKELQYQSTAGGFISILRPKSEQLDSGYLYRWFSSGRVQEKVRSFGNQTTNICNLDHKLTLKLQIPLPPLAEQKRIAAILDAADALRARRCETLAQLDTLLQSTFLDMFGDPVTNPKGWEPCTVGAVVHSAKDGPHVSPKYSEKGIPFLSTRHIKAGEVIWEDLKFIDQEEADRQWKKCKPELGDILYTKGGTTGIAARVVTSQPFAVWVHVALLKPIMEKVHPAWLEGMLNSAYCYTQSQRYTHGIANRDLGLKRMVKIKMYLPPLDYQSRFVNIVESVEYQKARLRDHLTELDTLFYSLQQRAFNGDL